MGSKQVLVISAHSPSGSFGAALAEAYAQRARREGHDVELLCLERLRFDPVLHEGYRHVQALEPDLQRAQQAIHRAQHLVFVYPIWWGSVPALLKGFLDRVLLPGFAFKYRPGKSFPDKLLAGRTAHIVATMDTPPWYFRWIYGAPGLRQMQKNTLAFCGIAPVKTLALGPVLGADEKQRARWLREVQALAGRIPKAAGTRTAPVAVQPPT
ncbi:NAD(P)H-dependent oxidoreductase [Azohydromonas australica]|uniref:NAD(P)H-dependent oxidoreductase n=1 Tax=Azohydromonas australica TaxID=364039 RepID=UPI00040E67F9|nr:NAD(P)H-dependent oxidoreductase [Azohydromonas australica]